MENGLSSPDMSSVRFVERAPVRGKLNIRKLTHGRQGLLLEVHLTKGYSVPPHKHGHESICYLITGIVRLSTENTDQIISPGGYWINPEGEIHSTHAIEDSLWLEFKAPPEDSFDQG